MTGTEIAIISTTVNIAGLIAVGAYNRGVVKGTVNGLSKTMEDVKGWLEKVEKKLDRHILQEKDGG